MPTLELETTVLQQTGHIYIAGVDEAGRGALAGPVVAAAVILPLDHPAALEQLRDVDDSKQLSAATRSRLAELIATYALASATGVVSAESIDELGILAATKQAMELAISHLTPRPDYLLIDGPLHLQTIPLPQQPIIRGDSLSLTIAAASILAKTTRDRLMVEFDARYPLYGFARHKGYGTTYHRAALSTHGPCAIHRHSFAPLRRTLL